jgi:hypothetical protein
MISVQLTSTTELLLLWGTSSCHAVIWNDTTRAFGTPALVRTASFVGSQDVGAVTVSSTSVLVTSLPAAGTALQTVVLSISDSTITVGTPVSTTLALASSLNNSTNVNNGYGRIVTAGSSYVLSYYNTGTAKPCFRAITVSGTTPTVGAELTFTAGNDATKYTTYVYSSTVLVHVSIGATLVYAVPISVSGSTLTQGTQVTSAVGNSSYFNSGVFSSGRIGLTYGNTGYTALLGAVVSITGTTASISTVSLFTSVNAPNMQFIGNQAIVCVTGVTSAATFINVLTDNAGTAVAGTGLQSIFAGAVAGQMISPDSTTGVYIAYNSSTNRYIVKYTLSGNSVVQSFTFPQINTSAATVPYASYSTVYANIENSSVTLRTTAGKIGTATGSGTSLFTLSFNGTDFSVNGVFSYNATQQRSSLNTYSSWGMPLTPPMSVPTLVRTELT